MSKRSGKKPPPEKVDHLQGTGSPFSEKGTEVEEKLNSDSQQPSPVVPVNEEAESSGTKKRTTANRNRSIQRDPNSRQCLYIVHENDPKRRRRCITLTIAPHGYCVSHAATARVKKLLQGDTAPEKAAVPVGLIPEVRDIAVFPHELGNVVRIDGKPGILLLGGRWLIRIRNDQTVEAVGKLQKNKYASLSTADENELRAAGIKYFEALPTVLE